MSSPTRPGTSGPARRRRRFPWWLVGLGLVAAVLAELWTLIAVGRVVGPAWTILLLVAAGVAGTWIVKREGMRAFAALREAVQQGRMPHRELADGVLILLGGLLMIVPGFLSDVAGLLMVLPFTRPLGRAALGGAIARRLELTYVAPRASFHDDVVPGEVIDPDRP